MDLPMTESAFNEPCSCGNNDFERIQQYKDEDGELIGVCCLNCNSEWLCEEVAHGYTDALLKRHFQGHELRKSMKYGLGEGCRCTMASDTRTKIEVLAHVGDYVKPGNHICWERPYVISHHAIVVQHDTETNMVRVIHYSKDTKGCIRIMEESIDVLTQKGTLYRVDYPEETTEANPVRLVLARARSRLGESGYGFLGNNCESFATYCKVGVNYSAQFGWLKCKIADLAGLELDGRIAKTIITRLVITGRHIDLTKVITRSVQASAGVTVGIIVFIEGAMCIYDLATLYKERRKGNLSRKDFVEDMIKRLMEGLGTAAGATGGLLLGEMVGLAIGTIVMPGIGSAVGLIIGAIIGGAVGGLVGKTMGVSLAPPIARAICATIRRDDRVVLRFEDLRQGDHLVLCSYLLHPRHHVIFVGLEAQADNVPKAKIIHSTYKHGVNETAVELRQPVYRVVYHESQCRPAQEVVMRARSQMGVRNFNILTNNCKDFAYWCKSDNRLPNILGTAFDFQTLQIEEFDMLEIIPSEAT